MRLGSPSGSRGVSTIRLLFLQFLNQVDGFGPARSEASLISVMKLVPVRLLVAFAIFPSGTHAQSESLASEAVLLKMKSALETVSLTDARAMYGHFGVNDFIATLNPNHVRTSPRPLDALKGSGFRSIELIPYIADEGPSDPARRLPNSRLSLSFEAGTCISRDMVKRNFGEHFTPTAPQVVISHTFDPQTRQLLASPGPDVRTGMLYTGLDLVGGKGSAAFSFRGECVYAVLVKARLRGM